MTSLVVKNAYRWVRGYPGIAPDQRALRRVCVLAGILLTGLLLRAIALHSLRVFDMGPLAQAQEADMIQAISACPAVRESLQQLRAAPSRRDIQEMVTRCSDLEPLRRAVNASAR